MRHLYGFLAFCILSTLVPCAASAQPNIDQAIALLSENKPDQAEQILRDFLDQNPGDANALFQLSIALDSQGQTESALEVLRRLNKQHSSPEVLNNLAVLEVRLGRYKVATEFLIKALQTDERYAKAYDNLNQIYGAMASAAYQNALEESASKQPNIPDLKLLSNWQQAPAAQPVVTAAVKKKLSKTELETMAFQAGQTAIDWAKAWSSQKADDYLSFYSNEFKPPDDISFAEWQQQRRQRLTSPRFINIQLSKLDAVVLQQGDLAKVSFFQDYRSNSFKQVSKKTLIMQYENKVWRIIYEQSGS